jgi:iron complex outermembrane recepter protein
MRTVKFARSATLAVGVLAATYNVALHAQDGALEEIVVTGSYIKGPRADAPSPITVIGRDVFDQQGAATLWDVAKNLNINAGSTTAPGTDGSNSDSAAGSANINLRGLGQNATLVLFDGKRQVPAAQLMTDGSEYVDILGLPMIAVERVEVLSDGGSALYGSDAIAGVVNYVLRNDFKGFEFRGDVQQIEGEGSTFDSTIGGLWGWSSNSGATHFVLGGEYFKRDPVPITAASNYNKNKVPFQITAQGTTITPLAAGGHAVNLAYMNDEVNAIRRANGQPENQATDPLCESMGFNVGYQTDQPFLPSSACWEDGTVNTFLEPGVERYNSIASFTHEFAPAAKFKAHARYAEDKIQRTDLGSANGLAPVFMMPVFTGGAPNITYVTGLSSQAAFAGNTPRANIPNAPNSLANSGLNAPALIDFETRFPRPPGGGEERRNESTTQGFSVGLQGDFNIGRREFSYDTSVGYSSNERLREDRVVSRDRLERALNGLGGPNCVPNGTTDFNFAATSPAYWSGISPFLFGNYAPGYPRGSRANMSLALTSSNQGVGDCQFLNPFLTAATNPALANSAGLLEWVGPLVPVTDKKNELYVFDAVVTGDMFQVPGGTARFAAGVQARKQRNQSFSYDMVEPGLQFITGYTNNTLTGVPNAYEYGSDDLSFGAYYSRSFDLERRINSVFTEFSIPIVESVETQLAVRYEDYEDIGSEISPKIAASWRPIESLLLRGSYTRSFRAPNVGIVNTGTNSGAARTQDLLSNRLVRAGLREPALANAEGEDLFYTGVGSPDLESEYATTYGLGFILTPSAVEGLSVQMDFWRFEYEDKIVAQPFIQALQEETDAFMRAAADPSTPYVTAPSLENNAAQQFVACNPAALTGVDRENCVIDPRTYQVGSVYRLSNGDLVNVLRGNTNAGEIVTDGVDVKISYQWDSSIGSFWAGLDYTFVNQYEISNLPGFEAGLLETGVTDAAGTSGDGAIVRSLPDHKGALTLSWGRGSHSATAVGRVIGEYDYLAYEQTLANSAPLIANAVTKTLDTYATLDLSYTFTTELAPMNLSITAAILDVFEEDMPYVNAPFQYQATVYDPRGRRFKLTAITRF